ncbi:hypothetical protein PZB75_27680 [Streptomyces sp. AM 4-1-1]|uniref:hypothetical protein n=1 Tax=Streptomyces sp. AM 4-1-1 TaxID=3028710 RepID=UPI0023BA159F|nr:hypothetical protein [Streptomyces sp. AM 4-1-1]WEH36803.1 hypothetical protein PZB75_27680 [Streptomyces sp. AM 4-1-1]
MSTTRHLVNRRRRLASVAAAERTATSRPPVPAREGPRDRDRERAAREEEGSAGPEVPDEGGSADPAEPETADGDGEAPEAPGVPGVPEDGTGGGDRLSPAAEESRLRWRPRWGLRRRPPGGLPAVLCALTVLLGAFAAWSFTAAEGLRDEPARANTALTDIGRTSEVKGRITEAVGAVFSYTYASPAKSDRAAKEYLVGDAVEQHRRMLADVRAKGPAQKLVLTTTVTESAVELLDGDRARLLVFADQSNTRTDKKEETTYAAAMFAVDAVRGDGGWRISAIDTFAR